MSRGGKRDNAGAKSSWIHGKTKTIRVPELLASSILKIARMMDEGRSFESVTDSKCLDLSGVSVRSVDGRKVVFLEDLIKAGFKIRPVGLSSSIRIDMDIRGI